MPSVDYIWSLCQLLDSSCLSDQSQSCLSDLSQSCHTWLIDHQHLIFPWTSWQLSPLNLLANYLLLNLLAVISSWTSCQLFPPEPPGSYLLLTLLAVVSSLNGLLITDIIARFSFLDIPYNFQNNRYNKWTLKTCQSSEFQTTAENFRPKQRTSGKIREH